MEEKKRKEKIKEINSMIINLKKTSQTVKTKKTIQGLQQQIDKL
tara:strand:- start:2077 stop:2208 length:132 start_codon:yes stop_codon:yes gene_type:complete